MCYEEKVVFDALKWLPYYNLKASIALLCPENSLSFTYPLLKNLLAFLLLKQKNSLFNLYGSLTLWKYFLFPLGDVGRLRVSKKPAARGPARAHFWLGGLARRPAHRPARRPSTLKIYINIYKIFKK